MSNPAESYESYMVPTLFASWASHLIQSANLQHGERVLGSGKRGLVSQSNTNDNSRFRGSAKALYAEMGAASERDGRMKPLPRPYQAL